MAGAGYYSCDACGGTTFYDANIDWDSQIAWRDIDMRVICETCRETHDVVVRQKKTGLHVEPVGGADYLRFLRAQLHPTSQQTNGDTPHEL